MTAEEIRKLQKEWTWRDAWQLAYYERKINRKARKGKDELVSTISPRPRVVQKLKENGFRVVVGYPIGIVIEW